MVFTTASNWLFKKTQKIFITDNPYCSSIYRPNLNVIKDYKNKHWRLRIIKNVVTYLMDTLDNVLKKNNLDCDFIKIDTQGSGLNVLRGSVAALAEKALVILPVK